MELQASKAVPGCKSAYISMTPVDIFKEILGHFQLCLLQQKSIF